MGSSGTFCSLVSSPVSSPTFSCSCLDSLHGLWTWVITCHVQACSISPPSYMLCSAPVGWHLLNKGFVHAEITLGSQFTFPYTRIANIILRRGGNTILASLALELKSYSKIFLQNCAIGLNTEEDNNSKALRD